MSDLAGAAARRADYVRALREERAGYVMIGRPDRVAAVDAELARVTGDVEGRSETPQARKPVRRRDTAK